MIAGRFHGTSARPEAKHSGKKSMTQSSHCVLARKKPAIVWDLKIPGERLGSVLVRRRQTHTNHIHFWVQNFFEQQCERVKNTLETRPEQRWLRPRVPALLVMVKKYLNNKKHLLASTIESQRCHGYAATKTVIDRFEGDLLCT